MDFPSTTGINWWASHSMNTGTTCLPDLSMRHTRNRQWSVVFFDGPTNDMLAASGNNGDHVFRMVVIGDNDPSVDCHHNGLTMIIEYE